MNIPSKLAHQFVRNEWVSAFSMLASIVSFVIVLYDIARQSTPRTGMIVVMLVAFAVFVGTHLYALRIRSDNRNLEEIAKIFREINSIYRKALFDSFWKIPEPRSLSDRLRMEEKTLKSICQYIAKIFSRLTYGKEFTVTVKLLTDEEAGRSYATTYVRNVETSERDLDDHGKYEVNTGKNIGLDQALRNYPAGKLSYFHSADLSKEEGYTNQRADYLDWYKSTIVVPIRCPLQPGDKCPHNIGFLTIDTLSRHQLNNGHHLVMLSALAEQMFNFMSIMRGLYIFSKEDPQ